MFVVQQYVLLIVMWVHEYGKVLSRGPSLVISGGADSAKWVGLGHC